MVDLQLVAIFEVQSTAGTLALLPLQELGHSWVQVRVSAQPSGPVDPVAIVGAACASHFDVPTNGPVRVKVESDPIRRREVPFARLQAPVLRSDPASGLVWMATNCPAPKLLVGQVVQLAKRLLGGDGGVVVRPASDDRVEMVDQGTLGRAFGDVSQPPGSPATADGSLLCWA